MDEGAEFIPVWLQGLEEGGGRELASTGGAGLAAGKCSAGQLCVSSPRRACLGRGPSSGERQVSLLSQAGLRLKKILEKTCSMSR